MITTPCLSNSLKKLFVGFYEQNHLCLNAKNTIWLLFTCSGLESLGVGLTASHDDSKFLREHLSVLRGISNVQHLSLRIKYVFDQQRGERSWGSPPERVYKGGNRRTEFLIDLLSLVRRLTSLELASAESNDSSPPFISCLSSLQSSFSTLRHLRLFSIVMDPRNPAVEVYSLFKNLKTLTLELTGLHFVAEYKSLVLPSTLEKIILPYYSFVGSSIPLEHVLQEDLKLAIIVKTKSLPNLKEVCVPPRLIDPFGKLYNSIPPKIERTWRERRRALKREAVFADGRVKVVEQEGQ